MALITVIGVISGYHEIDCEKEKECLDSTYLPCEYIMPMLCGYIGIIIIYYVHMIYRYKGLELSFRPPLPSQSKQEDNMCKKEDGYMCKKDGGEPVALKKYRKID